jgi:DNA polymerase III subunit delta
MIIFFFGEDSFRIKQKLNDVRQHFIKNIDPGSFSLEEINGEKTSIAEISEKINTGSLFTKKRMIIIKHIFKNSDYNLFKSILALIKAKKDDKSNALVFIDENIINTKLKENAKKLFLALKKEPYSQEFKLLNHKQVYDLAKNLLLKNNQPINPSALSLLIEKTNNDLWQLNNEINKLSALAKDRQIEVEDINLMVKGEYEEKIFILIDSFFEKRKSVAYKTLHEQLSAGLSPEYILTMIIRQIKILLEIKSAQKTTSSHNLAQVLNLHPYVVKKSLTQINNFNLNNLKKIFNYLIDLEYKNKTGQINLKNELFLLSAKGLLF